MDAEDWYQELIKPSWAPPAWVFSQVWAVLYIIIAISYTYVVYLFFRGQIKFQTLLPFLLNILFNLAFLPLQFGLGSNILATIDILLFLAALIWALIAIWPHAKWVTFVNIPYLAWGIFATILQITITVMNA